jgi:hypothetical protein
MSEFFHGAIGLFERSNRPGPITQNPIDQKVPFLKYCGFEALTQSTLSHIIQS